MKVAFKIIAGLTALATVAACTDRAAPGHCTADSINEMADNIAAVAYYTDAELQNQCRPIVFEQLARCGIEYQEYRNMVYDTMINATQARILDSNQTSYWNRDTDLIVTTNMASSSCGDVEYVQPSNPAFTEAPSLIFD